MVLIRSVKPPHRERNVPPRVAAALVGRGYELVPDAKPVAKRTRAPRQRSEPEAPPTVEESNIVGTVESETVEPSADVVAETSGTYMRRDMQAED
jgi:hypothetical protein